MWTISLLFYVLWSVWMEQNRRISKDCFLPLDLIWSTTGMQRGILGAAFRFAEAKNESKRVKVEENGPNLHGLTNLKVEENKIEEDFIPPLKVRLKLSFSTVGLIHV